MIAKSLGEIIVTPGAEQALERAGWTVNSLLVRHAAGDWGDISDSQRTLNELAAQGPLDLVSNYETPCGEGVVIYMKADRSHTFIHLAPSKRAFRRREIAEPSAAAPS